MRTAKVSQKWMLSSCDRIAPPEPAPVLHRGKRSAVHPINVERAVEVIDFVLENPRVPSGGIDGAWLPALIEILHADGARPLDDGGKTCQAEAALKELHPFISCLHDSGINKHVKWHWPTFLLLKFLGGYILQGFFLIFNHRKLD